MPGWRAKGRERKRHRYAPWRESIPTSPFFFFFFLQKQKWIILFSIFKSNFHSWKEKKKCYWWPFYSDSCKLMLSYISLFDSVKPYIKVKLWEIASDDKSISVAVLLQFKIQRIVCHCFSRRQRNYSNFFFYWTISSTDLILLHYILF